MLDNGMITAYKEYEDSEGKSSHYYEITSSDYSQCYYIKSNTGQAFPYGTEVKIDLQSNGAIVNRMQFSISNAFQKIVNVVNYQGFVIDCVDSNVGVYNLDNEIFLFGSCCLDLPIGINVTLFNLHLVPLTDTFWILKLFGNNLKKATHILVYCPAFSSFSEGSDAISYDNLIETRSNFGSLIYANQWAKDNLKYYEFPVFLSLDELASSLFGEAKTAKFIGHCEKCSYTENFTDLTGISCSKKLKSAADIKESFHRIKSDILKTSTIISDNQVLNQSKWLRNEIIYGSVKRKNSVLIDVISNEKSVSVYCHESAEFSPPDDSFILIFNALQIVEIVPKLRCLDSCTTKAYLWISPETRVWSPGGFFWSPKSDLKAPSRFVLCKVTQKYLILKNLADGQATEVTVIHVESEKGTHCFCLNPSEKFYGILSESIGSNQDILVLRHLIDEKCFQSTKDPFVLQASTILPIISCSLNVNTLQCGPLQVRLNDLPYLSFIDGLQFFSLKLRFYSISSLAMKLICSQCKSQVEAGKCLRHFENFTPSLLLSAVFETADMDGMSANVLIDRFPFFEQILGLKSNNKFLDGVVDLLKGQGKIKVNSGHFAFSNELNPREERPSLETIIASMIPRVSKVFTCTFPANMANSALNPKNLEFCDAKLELINILKLF